MASEPRARPARSAAACRSVPSTAVEVVPYQLCPNTRPPGFYRTPSKWPYHPVSTRLYGWPRLQIPHELHRFHEVAPQRLGQAAREPSNVAIWHERLEHLARLARHRLVDALACLPCVGSLRPSVPRPASRDHNTRII